MTMLCRELTLDDLLDDPMTQAVMRADRIEPAAVRGMLLAMAGKIENAGRVSTVSAQPRGRSGSVLGRWMRSAVGLPNLPSREGEASPRGRSGLCGAC
jgi:hypothetical protein